MECRICGQKPPSTAHLKVLGKGNWFSKVVNDWEASEDMYNKTQSKGTTKNTGKLQ